MPSLCRKGEKVESKREKKKQAEKSRNEEEKEGEGERIGKEGSIKCERTNRLICPSGTGHLMTRTHNF